MDKFKKLYESNTGDIIIKTNSDNINVISYIIKNASPVFDKMLSNNMVEKSNKEIDLSDYDHKDIDFMLRYIYYNDRQYYDDNKRNLVFLNLLNMYELKEYFDYVVSQLSRKLFEEKDEGKKSQKIIEYFKIFNNDLFKDMINEIIKYVISCFLKKIKKGECYDKNSDDSIRYCCKHQYKELGKSHQYLKSNPEYSRPKYLCIVDEVFSMGEPYYGTYDIDYNNNHKCCKHNGNSKDDDIYDIYNYDYLNQLDPIIRTEIIKSVFG